jgi:flavodoxin
MMQADIVFFSRTGNTRVVSEEIFNLLAKDLELKLIEIKSKKNYPYFFWLILSFLPYCGVKITCEDVTSDLVFVCFPKWTINCPPITTFLRQVNLTEKKVYLVITYGGFDEKRYMEAYKKKIKKLCKEVKGTLLVKRSEIKKGNLGGIRTWLEKVL